MPTLQLPYKFYLRDYQVEPWDTMVDDGFKRGIMVVPRRNGKDILCWNGLIAKAVKRVGLYYYIAPYYNQIRQIIWEGFDRNGRRFLDYIPEQLIANKTKVDMRIDLVNGSQIKLQGSDEINRIVGTNPYGIVFTEFSLHKPAAWEYLRPILAENGGWAMFNGTPRGLNHFYDLYSKANNDPGWYTQYLTRDDTGIPTLDAIEDDRQSGMPEALIQQEYYCSFMSGEVGSYYGDLLQALREDGRITSIPWDPRYPVFTAWDIGIRDDTAIWFAQQIHNRVNLIDYYYAANKGLQHYIKVCREKPYVYGAHFAPHDIEVREWGSGEDPQTRKEIAAELGFEFETTPKYSLADGHDKVRQVLPRCFFDASKTTEGFSALMGYKRKWNERLQAYADTPEKNWAIHGADSFRMLAHNVDKMDEFGGDIRVPTVVRSVNFRDRLMRAHIEAPRVRRAVS